MRSTPTILISSGEMSGDIHAAHLVRRIRERIPNARILAFAGDECREAGAELLFHYRDYAVLGITGILSNIPHFYRLERALKKCIDGGVDLFIPVDYPGLNLRLAAYARRGGVPVLYYIGPQVWAWGTGRLDKIARNVDRMALILPFEEPLYREHGVDAEFVGHPFVVDHELPDPLPAGDRDGVGLLPGSRVQEVRRILPPLLETQKRMQAADPALRFTIGRSPAVPEALYRRIISDAGVDVGLDDDAVTVMRRSRVLAVASGTATLQAALLETPLVIVYRASALNFFLGRRLVKIPYIGLANVVLGDKVCPEFLQADATAGKIAPAMLDFLVDDGPRAAMAERFKDLRRILSGGGGCERVADVAAQLLGEG